MNFDYQEIAKKYWLKLWSMFYGLLAPFIHIFAILMRRALHTSTYLYALASSKWYHWRCELPAGRFIFSLYLGIISTGTTLLALSQYRVWEPGSFNLPELLERLPRRWEIARIMNDVADKSFGEFIAWVFGNFFEELSFVISNLTLGPLNAHNLEIFVDALFTATSATCLTGMTTTDVSKYPPLIMLALILAGASSLIIIALFFNIYSFFQTESTTHGTLSLREYGAGRDLGKFTLKAMYASLAFGVLALTLYFLPPSSLTTFLTEESSKIIKSIQSNFMMIFIWLATFGAIIYILRALWQNMFKKMRHALQISSIYYAFVTGLTLTILLWLFYAEGHWELPDFFHSLANAVWLAISAFTNAGFDTYDGALGSRLGSQHYSQIMTVVVMLMMFLGSLGMQVVRDLPHVIKEFYLTIKTRNFSMKRFGMKISFDTKMILLANIFLWFFGGFMFWFFETVHGDLLSNLNGSELFFTSTFQSINMRTAGFSIHADVSAYSHPTLLLIMFMMLIGGSPNSMSGGMKVSTVAILFFTAKSLLERHDYVHAFGEAIPEESIYKAMTTFVLTLSALALALILIFSLYDGLQEDYFKIAFDVVGAFTTIGLNTGISDWNIPCKLILVVCMCFGKIGVLTIGMSMYSNTQKKEVKKI